jgi:hypothetical protein
MPQCFWAIHIARLYLSCTPIPDSPSPNPSRIPPALVLASAETKAGAAPNKNAGTMPAHNPLCHFRETKSTITISRSSLLANAGCEDMKIDAP